MNFQEWQNNFDKTKWIDSIIAGEDTCGTYEFCTKCTKQGATPCAQAFHRFQNPRIRIAVIRPRA